MVMLLKRVLWFGFLFPPFLHSPGVRAYHLRACPREAVHGSRVGQPGVSLAASGSELRGTALLRD